MATLMDDAYLIECYPNFHQRLMAVGLFECYRDNGIKNKLEITARLSRAFSDEMRSETTAQQLKEIRAKNTASGFDYCASHEYIDSNMTMSTAWKELFGFIPDVGGEGDMSVTFIDLWNDAWQMSAENGFRERTK